MYTTCTICIGVYSIDKWFVRVFSFFFLCRRRRRFNLGTIVTQMSRFVTIILVYYILFDIVVRTVEKIGNVPILYLCMPTYGRTHDKRACVCAYIYSCHAVNTRTHAHTCSFFSCFYPRIKTFRKVDYNR